MEGGRVACSGERVREESFEFILSGTTVTTICYNINEKHNVGQLNETRFLE